MNRREIEYNEGWHEGRRIAEDDLRNHAPTTRDQRFREKFDEFLVNDPPPRGSEDAARAWVLGMRRGYRDTIARFDAGELTWEMFDNPPLGS